MDRARLLVRHRARLVDRLADHVDDAAERAGADRHADRLAGVGYFLAAHQAFAGIHGDGAHGRLAEMLGDFEHQAVALVLGLQRVENRRQVVLELHVDDGADDLGDASDFAGHHVLFTNWFTAPMLVTELRAGDDLDQFLGDHRLAGAVVGERLLADHLAGVAGGVVHRRHLRAVERRRVLDERAENLHREIARQELFEDILFVRLELIDRAAQSFGGIGFEHRRNDLLRGRDLRDHRAEARVEQRADVEFELVEQRDDLLGDHFGVLEPQGAHRAQIDQFDDLLGIEPAQLIVTLAADAEEFDLFALGDQRVGALAGEPHDRGVERAAQAAFGGADQQQMLLIAAGAAQQPRRIVEPGDGGGDIAEHRVHVAGIGTRRLCRGLRTAQF